MLTMSLDAANDQLLRLDLPLRPAAASDTFMASLQVWTGRTIEIDQFGR